MYVKDCITCLIILIHKYINTSLHRNALLLLGFCDYGAVYYQVSNLPAVGCVPVWYVHKCVI